MKNLVLVLLAALTASACLTAYSGQESAERGQTRSPGYTGSLYTSMEKEPGKYNRKVKELFRGLLDHMGAH
ncbi:hypothetical protein D3C73_989870 [compost metagenome]